MLERDKNLLIIAGSGRNVGKTEFACRVIRTFCSQTDIYALKVSAVYPDEEIYHGEHSGDSAGIGRLFKETRPDSDKDTSRMLKAGASRVYYLRGEEEHLECGYQEFRAQIPAHGVVICESNSLREVVEPGLMILVSSTTGSLKQRAINSLALCDLQVRSDGHSGFPELQDIVLLSQKGWSLRSGTR
jgi:hypothetical protein